MPDRVTVTGRARAMTMLLRVYLVGIVVLALVPTGGMNMSSVTVLSLRADYLAHVVLYVPWAFLGLAARKREPLWFALGVLLAAGSEGLHHLLDYRTYNVNDLLANMIGVAAGYAAYIPVLRRRVVLWVFR